MAATAMVTHSPSCLKVVAASVTGQQHLFESRGCEDAWSTDEASLSPEESVLSVCICDGAGSAKYGAEGATLSSQLVAKYLTKHFVAILEGKTSVVHLVETVQDAIRAEATVRDSSIRDFACTVVAIALSTAGRWFAVHLGDGGIVMQAEEQLSAVSLPMKGQFSNITYFVTDADAAECIRYVPSNPSAPKPDAFVLFSDGVENLLLNRKTGEVAQAVKRMAGWLTKFSEIEVTAGLTAELTEFFRTQTGDDCSIAILNRVPMTSGEIAVPAVKEVNDSASTSETTGTAVEMTTNAEAMEAESIAKSECLPEIIRTPPVVANRRRNKRFRLLLLSLAIAAATLATLCWPSKLR